jgi:hypothetical protein
MRRFLPGLSAILLVALSSSAAFASAPSENGDDLVKAILRDPSQDATVARSSRPHGHGSSGGRHAPSGQRPSHDQGERHAAPPSSQPGRPPASVARHVPSRAPARNVVDHDPSRGRHGPGPGPASGPGARPYGPENRAAAAHRSLERRQEAAHHTAVARDRAAHHAWIDRHSWHPGPYRYGWHPHWAAGVFYYGPAPWYRETVVVDGGGEVQASPAEPERSVDRTGTFAVGLRGGSYLSGYSGGPGYGDFGMGLAARYRASEALGFELAWQYHDQSWTRTTDRINTPLSASVELFAFPWTRFNPYVFGGLIWTGRNYDDPIHQGSWDSQRVTVNDTLFGPQGGVGLELGVGQKASVNMEARFIGYVDKPVNDPSSPGAMQADLGFNFYF